MEVLFGAAATGTAAATSGLIGTAGSFAWAPALSTAGTAVGVMSSLASGAQRSAQYEAQQASAQYNAAVNRQRAEQILQAYGEKELAQRRRAATIIGRQRAASAQAGLGLGGSAADVERQSEVFAELDALNIRYEGELQARGLMAQADLDEYSAGIYGSSSKTATKGGYLGAAAQLLSGYADYTKRQPREPDVYRPQLDAGYDW